MYVLFDGDDVGPVLQLLLLDDDVEGARKYSTLVTSAVNSLATSIIALPKVELILAGGDDIVIYSNEEVSIEIIDQLRTEFHRICGRTMSAGLGATTNRAANNLRRAKLLGKNRTVA